MYEAPPHPAVAVRKRVDRFELNVRYCRLCNSRQIVTVGEADQVIEEVGHIIGRRRYELSKPRRDPSTDPALHRADSPRNGSVPVGRQQCCVNIAKVTDVKPTLPCANLNRPCHRLNVSDHVKRSPTGCLGSMLCFLQTAMGDPKSFDPATGYALRSKEETARRLQIPDARRSVKLHGSGRGRFNGCSHRSKQSWVEACYRIGNERVITEGLGVSPGVPVGGVGLPDHLR